MGDEDMIKLNKETGSWDHKFVQKTASLACPIQKFSNCQKKAE